MMKKKNMSNEENKKNKNKGKNNGLRFSHGM